MSEPIQEENQAGPPTWWRPHRRRRWRGMFGDIVVVVIGILIAFALDSWWSSRATRVREEVHLQALHSDFTQNLERLRFVIKVEGRIAAASRRLLILARSGELPQADTLRGLLLGQVFTSTRFEPVMGGYEAIVSSGGLTQIRDDTLRTALAEFSASLATRYDEQFANELYFAFTRDYMGRLPFVVEAVAADGDDALAESAKAAPSEVDPGLLQDPRFQAHLALRYAAERDVANRYRGLAEQAEAILARIERLLEE